MKAYLQGHDEVNALDPNGTDPDGGGTDETLGQYQIDKVISSEIVQ